MAGNAKGLPLTLPMVLGASALLLFFFLPLSFNLSPFCRCTSQAKNKLGEDGEDRIQQFQRSTDPDPISATDEDVAWLQEQLRRNNLRDPPTTPEEWHSLRKGINPRTRARQLEDFRQDELSLMAAFRYELPSQGLLHKHPLIVKGEDMDFSRFGSDIEYDLIYASAVFLHMPDALVWTGLERLATRLKPYQGRIFVSHNIKFCTRLHGEECSQQLSKLGLEYLGKHTHDSLLFNHYDIWFEFRWFRA